MQRFRTFISSDLQEKLDVPAMSGLPYFAGKAYEVADKYVSKPSSGEFLRQREKMKAAIQRGDHDEADKIQDEMDAITTGAYAAGLGLEIGAGAAALTGVGAPAAPFIYTAGVLANIAAGAGDIATGMADVGQFMSAKDTKQAKKQAIEAGLRLGSGVLGIGTSLTPLAGAGKAISKSYKVASGAEKAANAVKQKAKQAANVETKVKGVTTKAVDEYEKLKTALPPGHPERKRAFRKAEFAKSKADEAAAAARVAEKAAADLPNRSKRIGDAVRDGIKSGDIPVKPISNRWKGLKGLVGAGGRLLGLAGVGAAAALGNKIGDGFGGGGGGGGGEGGGGGTPQFVSGLSPLGLNVGKIK
jgi:hypothetical protein